MFRKLYLKGASPPRLPGAGPGWRACTKSKYLPNYIALKENEHGH